MNPDAALDAALLSGAAAGPAPGATAGPANQAAETAMNWRTLRFDDPDLELAYLADQRARNLVQCRIALLIAIGINSLFAPFALVSQQAFQVQTMLAQLIGMNAIIGAMAGLTYVGFFRTRWPALLVFVAVSYTLFVTGTFWLAPPSTATLYTFTIVILGIYVLLPFFFYQAIGTALLCTTLFLVGAHLNQLARGDEFWMLVVLMATSNVMGAFALYRTERFRRRDFANARVIARERGRFRDLLTRILPVSIADRLREGEQRIADHYARSTVLFADIVGFTAMSAHHSPEQVLDLLDQVFGRFDRLVDASGLEKIKTIGDAYMVAGGLPENRPDHARAICHLALDMQAAMAEVTTPDGRPLQVRIGIETGPLVAGVIGEKRFLYDLWGDTVNTASRMEASAEPGTIQVTAAVVAAVGTGFTFEPRGTVEVKGKGPMATHYLVGREQDRPASG